MFTVEVFLRLYFFIDLNFCQFFSKKFTLKSSGVPGGEGSGGGVRGREGADCQTLFTVKFLLTYREKRGNENRENGEEKKENCKRREGM